MCFIAPVNSLKGPLVSKGIQRIPIAAPTNSYFSYLLKIRKNKIYFGKFI